MSRCGVDICSLSFLRCPTPLGEIRATRGQRSNNRLRPATERPRKAARIFPAPFPPSPSRIRTRPIGLPPATKTPHLNQGAGALTFEEREVEEPEALEGDDAETEIDDPE